MTNRELFFSPLNIQLVKTVRLCIFIMYLRSLRSLRAGIREQDAGSIRRQVKKKSEATGKKEILKKK